MDLPKEIFPNPLVVSTVEIRFSSSVDNQKMFQVVYSKLNHLLPNVGTIMKLPQELIEQNPAFSYLPEYIIQNEDYSFSFSCKSLAFENVSGYKLWINYFVFIKKVLEIIFAENIIENIERIGVRYASILDNQHLLSEVLNVVPSFNLPYQDESVISFQTQLTKNDIKLFLQIFSNAKLTKDNTEKSGILIDIDSSISKDLSPNTEIFTIIDNLHTEEKTLFYSLLKSSFISTLNPKY